MSWAQAWVGLKTEDKFPVYAITGEFQEGTLEQLWQHCLIWTQAQQAGLPMRRVPRSVEKSIHAILTQDENSKAISHNAWLRAIAYESGKLYASFVCNLCYQQRKLLPSLGQSLDVVVAQGSVNCQWLGWECDVPNDDQQPLVATIADPKKFPGQEEGRTQRDDVMQMLIDSVLRTQSSTRTSSQSDNFARTIRKATQLPKFNGDCNIVMVKAWRK